ncbi:hypothetical protein DDE82_003324 [Stemphylium lycopersici]|nr:hypothetical protein DDE82_003324 [Stemphylium lycopersici]
MSAQHEMMQQTDEAVNVRENYSNLVTEMPSTCSPDGSTKHKTLGLSPSYLVRRQEDSTENASSIHSQTSTIEFEQKLYEAFQQKATQLVLDLFPGYCAEDVKIESMQGGGNNCVIGITLCKSPPKPPWYSLRRIRNTMQPCLTGRRSRETQPTPKKFILRIPSSPTQDMHHQVTTLAYLAHRISYPVPRVVVFDASEDNALGQAYMLQERLPGKPLTELWADLNQAQRLSATRAISNILLDLQTVKSRSPGIISTRNTTYDLRRDLVSTEPVPIPRSRHTSGPGRNQATNAHLSNPQTTKTFLLDLVARQRAHAAAANLPACDALWARVVHMIHRLHGLALIPDLEPFCLSHADLHPWNVLAVSTSEATVEVTGILNWDRALFAPAFVSMRAPFFLWDAGADGGEEALVEPTDEGPLEVKRAFESVVGEDFLTSAYCVELVLMRRLWHVLLAGFESGGDIWMAEEVLEEFGKLHALD